MFTSTTRRSTPSDPASDAASPHLIARLRSRLTFANVLSSIALFVTLGGGAYAYSIPRSSVGTAQLKPAAVTSLKIAGGAVGTSAVKDHSLQADDFADGQLPRGPRGDAGPIGARGPAGPAGPAGPSVSGFSVVRADSATRLPADESFATTVSLSSGTSKSGPITVGFPARLTVTGTTKLQNGDVNPRVLGCRLVLNPGADQQVISPTSYDNAEKYAGITPTLAGGVDVPAGTYDVGVQCYSALRNTGGLYSEASVTVVATAR